MDPEQVQGGGGVLVVSCVTAATLLFMLRARRQRRLRRGKQEKIGAAEDDFAELNSHLQSDLKNQIVERINQVKADIKARKLQRDTNMTATYIPHHTDNLQGMYINT